MRGRGDGTTVIGGVMPFLAGFLLVVALISVFPAPLI